MAKSRVPNAKQREGTKVNGKTKATGMVDERSDCLLFTFRATKAFSMKFFMCVMNTEKPRSFHSFVISFFPSFICCAFRHLLN